MMKTAAQATTMARLAAAAALVWLAFSGAALAAVSEPSVAQYTCNPIFQVNAVAPNIMILLDTSGSMNEKAYAGNYDHTKRYYGYFEPYVKYSYSSTFTRNTSGTWDGNFLNWAVMRRIDIARKVIMGGLATSRTGGGNQTNIGENSASTRDFTTYTGQADAWGVTPNSGKVFWMYISGNNFNYWYYTGSAWVEVGTFSIKVQKDATQPDEAPNFYEGNIAGVLQKVGSQARWGFSHFRFGTGNNLSGAAIVRTVGTNMTTLITDIQNTPAESWTPLAESYYTVVQYFKQQAIETATLPKNHYPNGAVPAANIGDDPWYDGTQFVSCAKAFVILLTDGESTKDCDVPSYLRDFDTTDTDNTACDEATGTNCDLGSGGTDYLDDIALYARTTDLRSATVGKTNMSGDQNVLLYGILANFGASMPVAETNLKSACKNGGFDEKDGTFGPTATNEWDKDGDGVPDTFYKADDGYELEAQLLKAINDILERAASGTAVSVLATSGEGEGHLVQAFFRPKITRGTEDYEWLGYLQSVWVDAHGNLREDTNANRQLDIGADKIITYFVDTASGDTKIRRFSVSSSVPYPDSDCSDGTCDAYETVEMDEIAAIWNAGKRLAERSATDRKIFTYIDKNNDGVVDGSGGSGTYDTNPFDDAGELVRFHTGSATALTPYFGVNATTTWAYLAGTSTNTKANRVTNLINWIRGTDITGLRKRTFDYDSDSTNETWKLGDIIHSTPVSVSKAPDNYHLIYGDESYLTFYNAVKDRETVVYVGANDGMVRAITSWKYANLGFTDPYPSDTSVDATYIASEAAGDELWAFIPQSLLPHLKWLPSTSYTHVFYVDLKPKIFDAKILADDTHYTDSDTDDNWGTFMLVGLNMGGGQIAVEDDFAYDGTANDIRTFYPSYTLIDITEPRNPKVIWERTYANLKMTTSTPAVVKVKNKWFAVFGSGPTDCAGNSSQTGKVFVVDLKTGAPYKNGTNDWLFQTAESNAFLGSPSSLDKALNFNVDAVYFGGAYQSGTSWLGKLYKVTVPWAKADTTYDGTDKANYVDNPLDATNPWKFHALFNATRPVTASPAISVDALDNTWVYFGTGRYLSDADKSNTDTQYLFGIKDPFDNSARTSYYHLYSASAALTTSDLLNADSYTVLTSGQVYTSTTLIGDFKDLITTYARVKDGWMRTLTISKERGITKPTVLGGVVFTPTFVPNSDVCGYGGDSYLYGLYYESGTAFTSAVFDQGTQTVNISGVGDVTKVLDKKALGAGKSSSLGIHVGQEQGATGYIQQSTGAIMSVELNPAFNIKSGLKAWIER